MNSIAHAAGSAPVAIRHFFWRHPEWWSVALCCGAWVVMLLHGWQHAGHGVAHHMGFRDELQYWMWMAAAMMLPLALEAVRLTSTRSLWARRNRAMAEFVAGFFAPWLLVGMAAAGLRELSWTHTYAAAAFGFLAAALWQRTSAHWRAFKACYRAQPLAPVGWEADRDCLRFGAAIGFSCVKTCWPLMLACALTGHSLIAMAGGMAVGAAERWSFRPRKRRMLAVTLALASYYVVFAILEQGVVLASR